MAGQNVEPGQRQMVLKPAAGRSEDVVEDPAHGEDGRTAIDRRIPDLDLPHLAAGGCRTLEHQHRLPAGREQRRCGQAADARSDDDDALLRHRPADPCCATSAVMSILLDTFK